MLRLCPRQQLPTLPVAFLAAQRRGKADIVDRTSGEYDETPAFQSPFKNSSNPTTKIPSFATYMSKKGEISNRTFQYFMVGGMGLLAAAGAKATVYGTKPHRVYAELELSVGIKKRHWLMLFSTTDFLLNMSASADVLAQAKVEIDLSAIPLGKNVFSFPPRIPPLLLLTSFIRSLLNGEESPYSYGTGPPTRSKMRRRLIGKHFEIHSETKTASKIPNGLSC